MSGPAERSPWSSGPMLIAIAVVSCYLGFVSYGRPWLDAGGWDIVRPYLYAAAGGLAVLVASLVVVAVHMFRKRHARRVKRHVNDGLEGLAGDARVRGLKLAEDNAPVSVDIVHGNVVHMTDLQRRRAVQVVADRTGVPYDATYHADEPEPRLHLSRAAGTAVLPDLVPMPAPGDRLDPDRLPYGVTATGTAWWDLERAHCLVTGETGMGKTVAIRVLVLQAWARGWPIFVVDPKKISFREVDGLPGIERSGDRRGDDAAVEMAGMIERVHDLVEDRYDMTKAQIAKLPRVLFVVDEVADLVDTLNPWWRANKGSGMTGTEHPAITRLGKIARLAREARVHMVYGIQRPDAKIIGGNTRTQFGHRISLGPLDKDGAQMMWRDLWEQAQQTPAVTGRALAGPVGVPGGPRQVQVWWVDPDAMAAAVGAP